MSAGRDHKASGIVVSGCGLVGPFGVGEAALAAALVTDTPCVGPCPWFETRHQVAAVRDFRLANHVKNPRAERSPRISQYALAAAAEALKQAGLTGRKATGDRTAIAYGTGNGPAVSSERSLNAIVDAGLAAVEPLVFQESVFNAPASLISIQFGVKGPVTVLPMGWAAGIYALKQGLDLLRCGRVERALVVAADELAGATLDALDRLGFVSPNDGRDEATRPFDARVNGAVLGEGAAALLLEREDSVRARGALPRVRIGGCAVGSDTAGGGSPDPGGEAMQRVMRLALRRAGRSPVEVDHVLAGTIATRDADLAEVNAVAGLSTGSGRPCRVTSLKSRIGETMGPAGLFNLVAGILEIERGCIFANHDLIPAVDRIDLPLAVSNGPIRTVLVNSIGVSGTYGSVVLESVS